MKRLFFLLVFTTISFAQSTDTLDVFTGLYLIGAVNTGAVPQIINSIPPPGPYLPADTLKRNKGYWVKVSQDGKILFGTAPQAPILASPSNGATNVLLVPTLFWNSSTGAYNYTLQVSINNQFTSFIFNQSELSSTSQILNGLDYATTYYWRVCATNNIGTSNWSSTWSFTTVAQILECGQFQVNYGGKVYNTVQIGSQCWLKENLDIGAMILGTQNAANNGVIEKYCYNNDVNNCTIYGGLYQWNEAMQYTTISGIQGICPGGFHIPTYAEFQALSAAVGGNSNALKAVGQGSGGGAGTNTSGFSALLAGYRYYDGDFVNLGYITYLWSSTEFDASVAYYVGLYYIDSTIYLDGNDKELDSYQGEEEISFGFSVRCLKD